jgi:hypothetical protein
MRDVAELSIGRGLFCQSLSLLEEVLSSLTQGSPPCRAVWPSPSPHPRSFRVRIRMVWFGRSRSIRWERELGSSTEPFGRLAYFRGRKPVSRVAHSLRQVISNGLEIRETAFFFLPLAGVLGSLGQRRKPVQTNITRYTHHKQLGTSFWDLATVFPSQRLGFLASLEGISLGLRQRHRLIIDRVLR